MFSKREPKRGASRRGGTLINKGTSPIKRVM